MLACEALNGSRTSDKHPNFPIGHYLGPVSRVNVHREWELVFGAGKFATRESSGLRQETEGDDYRGTSVMCRTGGSDPQEPSAESSGQFSPGCRCPLPTMSPSSREQGQGSAVLLQT